MEMQGEKRKSLAAWVESGLASLAQKSFRSPWATLAILALLTTGALGAASRLSLNADLAELLPSSFASVQDLERLKERYGGLAYVVVIGRGAEPDTLVEFANAIGPKLEALPDIDFVNVERPSQWFEDRGLYFLSVDQLARIRERLKEREAYEKRTTNPLYIDFEGEEPPSLDFSDILEEQKEAGGVQFMSAQVGESYYLDRETKTVAVFAKPSRMALDLNASKELVAAVEDTVAALPKEPYPGLEIELAGGYKKKVDQQELLKRDLGTSTLLAFVLVIAYLLVHFRRIAAVGMIVVPLVLGLLWTYGFAGAAFGMLNILTAVIGAILLGLGIDHGIHLLSRVEHEWARSSPLDSVRIAFGHTGRAVTVAALTTTVAFGGLAISEFRAFREFGIIAAVGMVLVVLAYATALPALLGLATRAGWQPRQESGEGEGLYGALLRRNAKTLSTGFVLLVVVALVGTPRVEFNYNFRSLLASDLPSFAADAELDRLLGYSQTPMVVLTENLADETRVAEELRERSRKLGDESRIGFVATGADLVPEAQNEKQKIAESIGEVLERFNMNDLDDDTAKRVKQIKSMIKTPPFDRNDLPESVVRQFKGKNLDSEAGMVLVFASFDLSEGALVNELADELRGIRLSNGDNAPVAGESMILADIFTMVSREAPPALAITALLVLLTLWLLLGSIRSAALALIPAAATLIFTLALMPFTGQSLNYLNIVLIPVFFGIGVDGGAHLVTRGDGHSPQEAIVETGRAISGSILTTGLGFGSLLWANHHGLNAFGQLAVLGLACNLLASLVGLPSLMMRRQS